MRLGTWISHRWMWASLGWLLVFTPMVGTAGPGGFTYECQFEQQISGPNGVLDLPQQTRTLTITKSGQAAYFFDENVWYDAMAYEGGVGLKRIDDSEGDCRGLLATDGTWFLECRGYMTTETETHMEVGTCHSHPYKAPPIP